MAGEGERFRKVGYTVPKFLIPINGLFMIEWVIRSLQVPEANYIFIVQEEHEEEYDITRKLQSFVKNCTIIYLNKKTEGAACTCLSAQQYIDNDGELILANCDQYLEWRGLIPFLLEMDERNADGGIVTFKATESKWSFVKTDEDNLVLEVAEKNPISNQANCGIFYWKYGKQFVHYANKMIEDNFRVNEEFYVSPVFNYAIQDNLKFNSYHVDKFHGLGTPEDLEKFVNLIKL